MWAKVDDGWWKHRKVVALSLPARGLWVTALSYCGDVRDDEPPACGQRWGQRDVDVRVAVR